MKKGDITLLKKELRQEMLIKRAKTKFAEKKMYDEWICDQLWKTITERNAKVVHAYLPMGKEIDIIPLLEKLLKNDVKVVTPKTLPKRVLENRVLYDLSEIEKGVFGTTHPLKADIYEGPFDLAIVPGLAFDAENYRLGYGGGYYDNFLANHPQTYKAGIFYPFQKVKKVPLESHDLRLDTIFSKELK
jgi:5-formyltetrahydrofolate cyclo-ligase